MTQDAAPAAVVDVGTNTVLMLAGRRRPDGSVEVLADLHAIGRLGQGVDEHGGIQPAAMDRVCGILEQQLQTARQVGAAAPVAYGTSALRDARNRAWVQAQIRERTGIELCVLSGPEEAQLTFAGAGYGLALPDRYAVLDIGGGSTELAMGSPLAIQAHGSVDVGAVRLTERYFPQLPPPPAAVELARAATLAALQRLPPPPVDAPLVGVAGTVTTLGALDLGILRFDAERLNGHTVSAPRVGELTAWLRTLDYAAICALPQVNAQRADLITAGALILETALTLWHLPGVTVSTRGLRYGLLLRALGLLSAPR